VTDQKSHRLAPADLLLPLRIRDRRESGDHQLQIVDQGAEGAMHMLVIYTRFDDRAFAEFVVRACNDFAMVVEENVALRRREEAALNIASGRTEEHIRFQRQRDALVAALTNLESGIGQYLADPLRKKTFAHAELFIELLGEQVVAAIKAAKGQA